MLVGRLQSSSRVLGGTLIGSVFGFFASDYVGFLFLYVGFCEADVEPAR